MFYLFNTIKHKEIMDSFNIAVMNDNDKESFIRYLTEQECYGNVAIVDSGWVGTAQIEIAKYANMIDDSSDIGGLYMGTNVAYRFRKRSKRSYACFYSSIAEQLQCQLSSAFLESLIGTNEQQVCGYLDGQPVFDREITEIPWSDVKKGAARFIDDWVEIKKNKTISPKQAKRAFERLFKNPRSSDINLLQNLEYEDVLNSRIISFSPDIHLFGNTKTWLDNLSKSPWKGGYFKRSFKHYRIPLNLYLTVNTIRGVFIDVDNIAKDNFD